MMIYWIHSSIHSYVLRMLALGFLFHFLSILGKCKYIKEEGSIDFLFGNLINFRKVL
jgi:hypothetical protein